MDEAIALRRRISLRQSEWEWVPRAARVALPEVAQRNGYEIPKSILLKQSSKCALRPFVTSRLWPGILFLRTTRPSPSMGWFETLTELEKAVPSRELLLRMTFG